MENLKVINEHAKKKGVNFVLETLEKNEPVIWGENITPDRIYPDVHVPSPKQMADIGKLGIHLCLDLAHLATWFGPADREKILQDLKSVLVNLKPFAHVLHLATIKPPFIVDTGNGFTPKEDALGVLPNSQEILELLKNFKSSNVIVIPEPQRKDHIWHNQFLRKSGLF